jgi:signal transduction histidine kinase
MWKALRALFVKLVREIYKQHEDQMYSYVTFGWFGIITYPFFYLFWRLTSLIGYENIYLRLAAAILCVPLVLKNYWPKKIEFLLPFYWHAVLCYSLPFLFTFFLLKNDFAVTSAMNTLAIFTLSILLIDIISLMVIYTVGITTGFLVYYLTTGPIHFPEGSGAFLMIYISVLIIGTLFSRSKNIVHQAKLRTIKSISGDMAHELRTPLRTIVSNANGLKQYLPGFFALYEKAKAVGWDVSFLSSSKYGVLKHSLDDIELEAQGAFTIINMMMVAAGMAKVQIEQDPVTDCSMTKCIENALQRYPFDLGEKELVHWPSIENTIDDFKFVSKELLIVHVMFNLLKNSFYHIKKARKGEIYIWLGTDKKHNILYFRDTGSGIADKNLPHIFDQFYSNTLHGTGIGLAFCKRVMQGLNGDIKCFSREGEFTEFRLIFPKK